MSENTYRSGFVTIIGCPNVGKSTLLNTLVGQKIAIVTDRAQTTRNKITGVRTEKGWQIVFLDTPGVTEPRNRLGDYMQKTAYDALSEVEAVLFVADATAGVRERDAALLARLARSKAPVFALLNKSDAASASQMNTARESLNLYEFLTQTITISAKTGEGVDALLQKLVALLPEGPQYFPDDMVTDQPERVIVGELIREKALLLLREEVPHGLGVGVDKMALREDGGLMDVWATLYCERASHKGIVIGKNGAMLKRIGTEARKEIEWLLDTRVNLQLWVKVKEDWRNKPAVLSELGYV